MMALLETHAGRSDALCAQQRRRLGDGYDGCASHMHQIHALCALQRVAEMLGTPASEPQKEKLLAKIEAGLKPSGTNF